MRKPREYCLPQRCVHQRHPQVLLLWCPCQRDGTRTFSPSQESTTEPGQIGARTEGPVACSSPHLLLRKDLALETQDGRLIGKFEFKHDKLLIPSPFTSSILKAVNKRTLPPCTRLPDLIKTLSCCHSPVLAAQ